MFGLQALQVNPEKVLTRLQDFEEFCMGERKLSPEEFKTLNMELSVSAVLHIGKRRFRKDVDGKHLIWLGPDQREHDLGLIDDMNVVRDYPGFHRSRSLSLGHEQVVENKVIEVPALHKQVTRVKMDDGSTGVGPNYKMALRNAALKRYLKQEFNRLNLAHVWQRFYGHA